MTGCEQPARYRHELGSIRDTHARFSALGSKAGGGLDLPALGGGLDRESRWEPGRVPRPEPARELSVPR